MEISAIPSPELHFSRITSRNVRAVCRLSETLSPIQRKMVADNALSIAQGHCSESAWMRAIYAGDTPIGFLMLHIGADYEDGIECAGYFLWRFMIAGPYQRQGYGRLAIDKLLDNVRGRGSSELYVSCELGEGSPEGFYRKLGFLPTGGWYGEEIELVLKLE